MRPGQARTVLIAGPTASGKSALALELAERIGGVIINADSMQVYRDLRILTARPTQRDETKVPHYLYGHVAASDAYSAGRFATDAARVIAEARAAGRAPVIVGGTGLYFKVLLEGLSPIPAIAEEIRGRWRGAAARIGAAGLAAELAHRDPEMAARLKPTDPQRMVRALEVIEATGRSLAEWQRMPGKPVVPEEDCVGLVVSPERDALHRRIDARFDAMMAAGALEEVSSLGKLGIDPALPAMRALGVRPLMQLLAGEVGRDEAAAAAKAETRQFAKRQLTWLRGNMRAWKWLSSQEMERIKRGDLAFIDCRH